MQWSKYSINWSFCRCWQLLRFTNIHKYCIKSGLNRFYHKEDYITALLSQVSPFSAPQHKNSALSLLYPNGALTSCKNYKSLRSSFLKCLKNDAYINYQKFWTVKFRTKQVKLMWTPEALSLFMINHPYLDRFLQSTMV